MNGFRHALVEEILKAAAAVGPVSRLTPESSNVSGYSYDRGAKQLTVTFKSGGTYRYSEVPGHVVRALGRNKSTGRTLNKLVKGGGYAYEKISGDFRELVHELKESPILDIAVDSLLQKGVMSLVHDHPPRPRPHRHRKHAAVLPAEAAETVTSFLETRRAAIKLAGVAKKQVTWNGLPMKIEYEPGDVRSGMSKDGKKWERVMKVSYGYIPGTKGQAADGDAIDVYFAAEPVDGPVFEIRQNKKDGTFDEEKFMIGWRSADEAKKAYLQHMPEWAFGTIKQVTANAREFASKFNTSLSKVAEEMPEYSLQASQAIAGASTPIASNPKSPSAGFGNQPRGLPMPMPSSKPSALAAPKPAPANVTPQVSSSLSKTSMPRFRSGFLAELVKQAAPTNRMIKHGGMADFILGEVPGGSIVQRGISGGPRHAARAFAGSALGGVPGALAGMGAGRLIEHAVHHGKPVNIPGVNISLSELLAGLGGTIGAVKGLRHFAPDSSHH